MSFTRWDRGYQLSMILLVLVAILGSALAVAITPAGRAQAAYTYYWTTWSPWAYHRTYIGNFECQKYNAAYPERRSLLVPGTTSAAGCYITARSRQRYATNDAQDGTPSTQLGEYQVEGFSPMLLYKVGVNGRFEYNGTTMVRGWPTGTPNCYTNWNVVVTLTREWCGIYNNGGARLGWAEPGSNTRMSLVHDGVPFGTTLHLRVRIHINGAVTDRRGQF